MKIKKIDFIPLRNKEHFQFHRRFSGLVMEYGSEMLKVKPLFEDSYLPCFQKEEECMKWIRKSFYTKELEKIDSARDRVVRGLAIIIEGYMYHLNKDVIQAARRLKILIDAYGDIPMESYDGESAAIYKLVKELRGEYSADAAMIGLEDWIDDLESCNQQFEKLAKKRNAESAARTDLRMKRVREEIDPVYRAIIEDINALIRIEGETVYARFVEEHNLHIEHFKNIIAQRKGRAAAGRAKENDESNTNYEQ